MENEQDLKIRPCEKISSTVKYDLKLNVLTTLIIIINGKIMKPQTFKIMNEIQREFLKVVNFK